MPYRVRDAATFSRFEKAIGGVLGGALLGHGHLQPLDFRRHQRDALGQFLDRQQRQVLPDLVGDFLPRFVVVLDRHAFSRRQTVPYRRAAAETRGIFSAANRYLQYAAPWTT